MKNESSRKSKGEGNRPSASQVMQEIWSLQRDVLRELMNGFRRLEESQRELSQQFEAQGLASPDSDVIDAPGVAAALDGRIQGLEESIERLETSLQSIVGATGTDFQDKVQQSQQSLLLSLTTTSQELGAHMADLRSALRDSVAEMHDAVTTSLREAQHQTRKHMEQARSEIQSAVEASHQTVAARLEASQTEIQNDVRDSQSWLQSVFDKDVSGMRQAFGDAQRVFADSINETRIGVQDFVGRSVNEARDSVVSAVDRLAQEVRQVRELRSQVKLALDGLHGEVRDVSTAAGRLESASVLTQELLDEQRQYANTERQRQQREEARKHNNAGVLCYHEGVYDASVKHFRKAIELDGELSEAYNNLGLSYTEMGRDDEATDAFKHALEIDPALGQVYNNLGYLYHRRGDLEHAVEMYQRAIQRSSDSSAAYTNLGNALYRLQRIDDSVKAWQRALKIDPANQKAAAALERVGLGYRGAENEPQA